MSGDSGGKILLSLQLSFFIQNADAYLLKVKASLPGNKNGLRSSLCAILRECIANRSASLAKIPQTRVVLGQLK